MCRWAIVENLIVGSHRDDYPAEVNDSAATLVLTEMCQFPVIVVVHDRAPPFPVRVRLEVDF